MAYTITDKLYATLLFIFVACLWYIYVFRAENYIRHQSKCDFEQNVRLGVVVGRWVLPIIITILFTIMIDVWGVPVPWRP